MNEDIRMTVYVSVDKEEVKRRVIEEGLHPDLVNETVFQLTDMPLNIRIDLETGDIASDEASHG